MIDIQKELQVLITRKGISMTKLLNNMREAGYKVPVQSNMSAKFKNENVKFKEIQEILDYLGYKINIEEK